ncbi:MAG: DUF1573 domain-containing protein [Opitutae bacterium]|nr:DUF1573 domain-containing protein [Opitutae bacterium]
MFASPFLLPGLLATLVLPAAALEWKRESLTVATAPFQQTQDVVFEFRNTGSKPVTLLDLQTNCDCLDASADREVYAPGASGTIKARFTVGDHAGLYERLITVVTDESPAPLRLVVRIEVPEIAQVAPRSVRWIIKGHADEKTIVLAPATGVEINFTGVVATNDVFSTRLETVEPGRSYRLHLTPRSTAVPASAAIRVSGREKSGRDVVVSAYASIQ